MKKKYKRLCEYCGHSEFHHNEKGKRVCKVKYCKCKMFEGKQEDEK